MQHACSWHIHDHKGGVCFSATNVEKMARVTFAGTMDLSENGDPHDGHQASLEESVHEGIRERLEKRNMLFRMKTVEEAIGPLVDQVTNLSVSMDASKHHQVDVGRSHGRLKRTHNVHKLIELVDKATRNFVAVGEQIASENPEFQKELLLSCDEVKSAGEVMQKTAAIFASDTSRSDKREVMKEASRDLLMAVVRLMVIADAVDVSKLLNVSNRIEEKLRSLSTARNDEELMARIKDCSEDIANITQEAVLKQNNVKCEANLQLLAATQTELNQASRLLISASKAFIQFPGLKSAMENQEYVIACMLDSLNTLALLADEEDLINNAFGIEKPAPGEAVMAFKEFQAALDCTGQAMGGQSSAKAQHNAALQLGLEKVLGVAGGVASSENTRDHHQRLLIMNSDKLKSKVNELSSLLEDSEMGGEKERETLSLQVGECVTKSVEILFQLRKQLCYAAMDHVSDAFVDNLLPLLTLCEPAQTGDTKRVESVAPEFMLHAASMQKAAQLVCSLSEDVEGIRMVQVAAKYVRTLAPQVVAASSTLAARPESGIAQKNMSVFKKTWLENVTLLTDAVNAITPLLDFTSVTESHIQEDVSKLLLSSSRGDGRGLREAAVALKGRCSRLAHMVKTEIRENPVRYSQDNIQCLNEAVQKLESKSMVSFNKLANKAISSQVTHPVDTRDLEEAAHKMIRDVVEIQRGLLVAHNLSGSKPPPGPPHLMHFDLTASPSAAVESLAQTISSSETQSPQYGEIKFQRTPRHSSVFSTPDTTARTMMAQLSEEHQAQLAKVAEGLRSQKAVFEREVSKWDEHGNDIVVLAKEICVMMMDMSDFTRGKGPLHTTMDVIVSARDIARAAESLDHLARHISEQCPDQQCCKDLQAYLGQLKLYCHQLKITAAVKADLNTSTRETVDNASTLITTAENLMKTVVETVKSCYIASTAIARLHGGDMPEEFVQWRLTMPRKKRLVWSESVESSPAYSNAPILQLGQFRPEKPIIEHIQET